MGSTNNEPLAFLERLFHRLAALPVVVQWTISKRWTMDSVDWGVYHPSPPHFVIRGLKSSFSISANLPTVAFLFFFRTNSTDSADCLPILLRMSVFYFLVFLFHLFLVFDSLRQIMLTYVSFWARIFSCRIEPFACVERLFHRLTALPVVVQWAMSKRWTTESAVQSAM